MYAGHALIRPGETTAYLSYLMAEPKRHVSGLEFLSDDEARALGSTVARLSRALVAVVAAEHVYTFVLGDQVVPRCPGAPMEYRGGRVDEWLEAPRAGPAEIEALSARLRMWLASDGALQPAAR